MMEREEITVRSGFDAMNFGDVTAMLETAYWCLGIGKEEVERSAMNSALVLGAFTRAGEQVGYVRAISDKVRFAYILDVIVRSDLRGRGIGKAMIAALLDHEELKDVYQWLLITRDAHTLYEKAGFKVTARPNDWMELRKPRPDRSGNTLRR